MNASHKEPEDDKEDKKLIRTTGRLLKQTADQGDHCVLCGLPEDDLQMINELCARDTDYQLLETICSNRFHIQITEPIVTTHCLLHLPSPLFHTWMLSHRFHEQTKQQESSTGASHSLLKRDNTTSTDIIVPSGGVDVRLLASQLVDDAFRTVANNPGIVSPAVGLQAAHFLKAVEEAERDRREKEASKESDSWEVAYNTLVEACQSVLDEDMMRVLGEKVEQLMSTTTVHVEET